MRVSMKDYVLKQKCCDLAVQVFRKVIFILSVDL